MCAEAEVMFLSTWSSRLFTLSAALSRPPDVSSDGFHRWPLGYLDKAASVCRAECRDFLHGPFPQGVAGELEDKDETNGPVTSSKMASGVQNELLCNSHESRGDVHEDEEAAEDMKGHEGSFHIIRGDWQEEHKVQE
ncbi:hypothetical protein GN956_G3781 [Arapaima gigas]